MTGIEELNREVEKAHESGVTISYREIPHGVALVMVKPRSTGRSFDVVKIGIDNALQDDPLTHVYSIDLGMRMFKEHNESNNTRH